ncbi:hypothetical protein [uncultured Nonlabens sp.]|uniref:hypothetical protein n=1 Tax=uncultured Nonlabens sp. TaxID=859306 RepID=UPI0026237AD0|nr:hypothetical protein [uncultured Nonlabens sp.]
MDIIVITENFDLELFANLKEDIIIVDQTQNFIYATQFSINEFENNEIKVISREFEIPKCFLVDTNSFEISKKLVSSIPSDIKVILHNDNEHFFSKSKFLKIKKFESFLNPFENGFISPST